jgi:hypothetical protein
MYWRCFSQFTAIGPETAIYRLCGNQSENTDTGTRIGAGCPAGTEPSPECAGAKRFQKKKPTATEHREWMTKDAYQNQSNNKTALGEDSRAVF